MPPSPQGEGFGGHRRHWAVRERAGEEMRPHRGRCGGPGGTGSAAYGPGRDLRGLRTGQDRRTEAVSVVCPAGRSGAGKQRNGSGIRGKMPRGIHAAAAERRSDGSVYIRDPPGQARAGGAGRGLVPQQMARTQGGLSGMHGRLSGRENRIRLVHLSGRSADRRRHGRYRK